MLQVQKGTGVVRHSHKNQHGKNMQRVFWRRKLVTSIPSNQTCRPGPPVRGRPIPAMFPVIVSCLKRPRQPFTSLSQPGNPDGDMNDAIDDWSKHQDSSPLEKVIQAAWDDLACRDTLNSLLNTNNPWNYCRLLAAQESHTAAWSEALPITSVGNLLSPDELRIAIALRTGAKIFESSRCRCGKVVDELGLHGLSCAKTAGRFSRHSAINCILKRLLTRIGLPSTLEPVGLSNDGRRPDGLTLGPWYRGLSLVWDATVVDTFAQGHYKDSARQAGFAATKAEAAKCQKYHDLQSQLPLTTSGN